MKNLIIPLIIISFKVFSQKKNNLIVIDSQKVLIEKLEKIAKEHPNKVNQIDNSVNDYSELGNGSGRTATFPEEYEEMAKANDLNPFSMPNRDTLDKMQSEYEREKFTRWFLIVISVLGIFLVFKYIAKKRSLNNKS